MFKEVTIGPCKLFNADCMDVLHALTGVDAVVTDPPYGISLDTDNSRFSGGTKGNMANRGNGIGSAGGAPITGVACIQTDRQFIGIEREPKYFDIACDRIQRAWDLKCSELPFEKPVRETQRSLLEAVANV